MGRKSTDSGSSGSASPVDDADTAAMAATMSSNPSVAAGQVSQKWRRRVCETAAKIADHKFFVIFGILLTVWALSGDDLRLLLTNQPADGAFDAMVVFCIIFFTAEVMISCIGKDDYFLGFFFGLDIISTTTLFLDLTVVSNALFSGDGGGDETDNARSSKTARAGARVGRVVRVLRLFRIVKLFKAAQGEQLRKKKEKEKVSVDPGNEDFDLVEDDQKDMATRESYVGKKLSARTTQRTIILVLVLLIFLPLLSMDSFAKLPASAEYGADDVQRSFSAMVNTNASRSNYEETLLRYIYYHNWFMQSVDCTRTCSNAYYSQVFWIGMGGESTSQFIADAAIRPAVVQQFDDESAAQEDDHRYDLGTLPEEVIGSLSTSWDKRCVIGKKQYYGVSLLTDEIDGLVSYAADCPGDLRALEVERFTPRWMTAQKYKDLHFIFFFDMRPYTQDEAQFNILKTVFVCVVLCVASLLFSKDANALVLQPVEHMINKVEAIRDNPLGAMKMADDEFEREEKRKREKAKNRTKAGIIECYGKLCKPSHHELMETVILEKTIIKLGSLLALGFGEAGANIVSHNMKGSKAGSTNVDAMIEGSRVDCIVGNARIRHFSTATEVLQGKVMTFVNQVAEIVHGIADQFCGAVNKNSGDTFLVIWRTTGLTTEQVSKMADMSLIALARIMSAIASSPILEMYRHHPGLQQRLRQNCRVSLSFGLHCGWAFEGAVGSEFKIDASYLSPNVNIAESLERATRVYDVHMLVSDSVALACTPEMTDTLRIIDKVIIKGSKEPLQLYCMDLDVLAVPIDKPGPPLPWNPQFRYQARQKLDSDKKAKWMGTRTSYDMLQELPDTRIMRKRYTLEFNQVFCMGYQNYSQGEWQVARRLLGKTHVMLRGAKDDKFVEDGPSGALLRFMESHNFEAPQKWEGVRELDIEAFEE